MTKRVQMRCLVPALAACTIPSFARHMATKRKSSSADYCVCNAKCLSFPVRRRSLVFGKYVCLSLCHGRFDAWAGATLMMAVVPFSCCA